jgi:hypothetical protein
VIDNSTNSIVKKGEFPLRTKSGCCGEVLLLSMTDVLSMIENKIGYKCDEAFLEEAAIRLFRNSFKRNAC